MRLLFRLLLTLPLSVFLLIACASAQVTTIVIPAGSNADQALQQINAEQDPAKKLAGLQDFVQKFASDPEAAAYGYWQLAQIESAAKHFPQSLAYGDKALALEPHSLEIISMQADTAEELKQLPKVFDYASRGAELFNGIGHGPTPANMSAQDWASQKHDDREANQPTYEYLQALAYNVIAAEQDPKKRMDYIEKFNSAFPDSKYQDQVSEYAILTLQSLNDPSSATAYGEAVLAQKPDDLPTLLMMADIFVQSRDPNLVKGIAYAQRAVEAANADAKDADARRKLSAGLAHADIGFALFKENKFSAAIPELRHAAGFLKSSPATNGRVLYALGQSYTRLAQYAAARDYLSQAAELPGPAQAPARQLLADINKSRH